MEANMPMSMSSEMSLNGFKSIAFANSRTMMGALSCMVLNSFFSADCG